MLTANVKLRLDVPGEADQWVEIRKLPWRKLREASDAQQTIAYAHVKTLGKEGLDAVKDVTPDQIAALRKNPLASYDAGVLLRAAVTAWSYSAKPTPEEIDDQDDALVEWLVGEIVTLAKPPRSEADEKNA